MTNRGGIRDMECGKGRRLPEKKNKVHWPALRRSLAKALACHAMVYQPPPRSCTPPVLGAFAADSLFPERSDGRLTGTQCLMKALAHMLLSY